MVPIKDYEGFATEFEKYYFGRGFGSMNKNELEVLFFHLLKKFGDIQGSSNFQLARTLHIPESKVKRLAYEAELTYQMEDSKALQERFLLLLEKAKIIKENGTLRFVVEDKYLRSTIYEDLKQRGYYLDTSFNSEIVSIHKEALIELLDLYYEDDKKKELVETYKSVRKKAGKADKEGIGFKSVMNTIFNTLIEKGTESAFDGLGDVNYRAMIEAVSHGIKAFKNIISIVAKVALLIA